MGGYKNYPPHVIVLFLEWRCLYPVFAVITTITWKIAFVQFKQEPDSYSAIRQL